MLLILFSVVSGIVKVYSMTGENKLLHASSILYITIILVLYHRKLVSKYENLTTATDFFLNLYVSTGSEHICS